MVYILVGLAGMAGAVLRYLLGMCLFVGSVFPVATLLINLSGSFLLAWLTAAGFKRLSLSQKLSTAIATGFVGSFTTFSAVSVETVDLFQNGSGFLGIVYIFVSVLGGLWLGNLGLSFENQESSSTD